MKKRILMAVLLATSSLTAPAAESELRKFFTNVSTLQANFSQRVTDESGMTLETSTGVFYLSRPGKFRWNYDSSDNDLPLGQQIISDGSLITFFEPELETASQRSFKDAVQQVPTMVLVQSGGDLDKHFMLTDFGLTDGLSWVALKPKDSDAGYQELMIGFKGPNLNTIILTDGLGTETKLVLSSLKTNSDIEKSIFGFVPPAGVDVVN